MPHKNYKKRSTNMAILNVVDVFYSSFLSPKYSAARTKAMNAINSSHVKINFHVKAFLKFKRVAKGKTSVRRIGLVYLYASKTGYRIVGRILDTHHQNLSNLRANEACGPAGPHSKAED
jgi:hypothetical protein